MFEDIVVAVVVLVLLAAGMEAGYRFGRRKAAAGDAARSGTLGAIQGAVLGLLGLLLGFSFAGAAARFLERQDLITQEANAIGTAFLRADLLEDAHRAELRASLARYVEHRIRLSETLRAGLAESEVAEIDRMHDRIWKAASAGALARPSAAVLVVPAVNDVIDLHSTRIAAGRKHLPIVVLCLLFVCSILSMTVIGYGCGLAGGRSLLMTGALAILITAALWTTLDLDHPRTGLIRLSDAPLKALRLSDSG